jgi:hypothetical protein
MNFMTLKSFTPSVTPTWRMYVKCSNISVDLKFCMVVDFIKVCNFIKAFYTNLRSTEAGV